MSTSEPPEDRGVPGLSGIELEAIFRQEVTWTLTQLGPDTPVRQEHPEVVFILAQPAAGSFALHDQLRRSFTDRGGIVPVVAEDFRFYHPAYRDLVESDPAHVGELTDPAARWLADRAVEWLREASYNVVVEEHSGDPDKVFATAGRFADAGYQVRVAALAVPPALSRITIIETFARAAEVTGTGPWTTAEEHDARHQAIAEVVRRAETSSVISRITIDTRDGPVHDVERSIDGAWRNRGPQGELLDEARRSPLEILNEARSERFTPLQRRALANRLTNTVDSLLRVDVTYTKVHEMAVDVHRDLRSTGFEEVVTGGLRGALDDLHAANQALDAGPNPDLGPDGPDLPPDVGPEPGPDVGPEL